MNEFGNTLDYYILPVHKKVRLKLANGSTHFDSILLQFKGEITKNIYSNLKDDVFFVRTFPLFGYHAERLFYVLSNGWLAVDQSKLNKANPYYACESFDDFKLIAQYLSIFRVEKDAEPEVQCLISEHFEIKKFLEKEKGNLKFVKQMSDDRYKLFITEDGKCIYVSYWGNMKGKWLDEVNAFKRDAVQWYSYKEVENEDEFYWSLVIYESMEKLKLHNVDLK